MEKIILSIKEALEKRGISETRLAELAGVSQKTTNRLLKGETKKPDINVLKKLASVLGIVIGDLIESRTQEIKVTSEESRLLTAFRALNEEDKRNQLATLESLADKEMLLRERDSLVGALENFSGDAAAAKRISEKAAAEHARKKRIADASDKEHLA